MAFRKTRPAAFRGHPSSSRSGPEVHLSVRRTGFAAILYPILRSRDAGAATISADTLELVRASRSAEIPLGDIEGIDATGGRLRNRIRIFHAGGLATVSGLSREASQRFADALEAARTRWWRERLAAGNGRLHAVHHHVSQLANPPRYLTGSTARRLERGAREVSGLFPSRWPDTLCEEPDIRQLHAVRDFLDAPDLHRKKANAAFAANEMVRSRTFFDRIETRPLTDEQRTAIVVDEDHTLVVAAAGSGKTSVIVAKAGWLLHRGYRQPSELLALAFARDARKELEERLRKRLGGETANRISVRTFHALGLAIIGRAEGRRPTLARTAEDERALHGLLQRIVADLLADGRFGDVMRRWFADHFAPYRSQHEFRSWGDYWNYIRQYEIRSLQGDRVRSFEECEIANFLYLNGIPYEYERPYEHDTATPDKTRYRPDFHLSEAGIYIEHFAITKEGTTPPFIDRDNYLQGMDWKRRCHRKHGTVLIETYSHERASGRLIRNLERKLNAQGVPLSPIPPSQTFAALERQGRVEPFIRLVAAFLGHFKGGGLSFGETARRASGSGDRRRAEAFLEVFEPILERYRQTLSREGAIDFHDMIGRATEHVESGRYRSPYGHILVDEFQDISPERARLLKALLDNSPGARLFAVGDDWQAIFRFGGSDIAVMREFGERFGDSERVDLETTFRCSDRLAATATRFVLRNPAQIRKEVRAVGSVPGPAVHVGLPGDGRAPLLKDALSRIAADAAGYPGTSEVLLLGRYRHTRPANLPALKKPHPGLRLSWMTVHGSKGLEADYAVVLDMCAGRYGFPSEIADDPLLALVLAAPEQYPNAEERRLLYVAMTRARRRVFLLAEGGPPSPFVRELLSGGYDVAVFGGPPEADVPCPVCVEGRLERRRNARNGGAFHGCSNWPYCEHTQPPCPVCRTGLPVKEGDRFRCRDCGAPIESCPVCGGWLRERNGRSGRFLGCSNWPACKHTRNIVEKRGRPAAQRGGRRRGTV